jgi:hypothetical protein
MNITGFNRGPPECHWHTSGRWSSSRSSDSRQLQAWPHGTMAVVVRRLRGAGQSGVNWRGEDGISAVCSLFFQPQKNPWHQESWENCINKRKWTLSYFWTFLSSQLSLSGFLDSVHHSFLCCSFLITVQHKDDKLCDNKNYQYSVSPWSFGQARWIFKTSTYIYILQQFNFPVSLKQKAALLHDGGCIKQSIVFYVQLLETRFVEYELSNAKYAILVTVK